MGFPQQRDPSVAHVVGLVRQEVGNVAHSPLVGLYPFGSLAFGDYVAGVSDVNLIAVVAQPISRPDREHIVKRVVPNPAIGLPVAGLQLTVITSDLARSPEELGCSEVSLQLRSGDHWTTDVTYGFDADPMPHIAAATVRDTEVFITGPSPLSMFGAIPRPWLLGDLSRELDGWIGREDIDPMRTPVLTACRAWRYAGEGTLSSKLAAGEWAIQHLHHDSLVQAALSPYYGRSATPPNAVEARRFVDEARHHLARQLA